MNNIETIPEFFAGKSIFLTGGTGFIGKVLIEKLLRSCPDIDNIYVLIRKKKGVSPEDRINAITDLALFDLLKQQNKEAVKKIKPVLGDVGLLGLGLSNEDRQILIDRVSVVYHAAASVRFDDPLQDAIILNTRGTREVVDLSKQMRNLAVLVHISTTFCHSDKKVIGEQIYPAHANWRDAIQLAENCDRHSLDVLTPKYTNPLPNTYTFTKSLAEHVVYDLCEGSVPTVIFRPSIVISSWKEPIPGWIDNFNGPVGLMVAVGKGVLRTIYTNPNVVADFVPVDVLVRGLIVATWDKAITQDVEDRNSLAIYNGSQNDIKPTTMGEVVHIGKQLGNEIALNNILWYPDGEVTSCKYNHYIKLIFYHLLPALFIDGLLKITGLHKPLLIKVHRKIYIANMALEYFITNQWTFINERTLQLERNILPQDRNDFEYICDIDVYDYFRNAMLGGRLYLMREAPETLEAANRNAKRMWIIAQIFNFGWYVMWFWLIVYKLNVLNLLATKYHEFIFYLNSE